VGRQGDGAGRKGAELDKIRKAQAINKAAAEKAEETRRNAARDAKEKEAAAKATDHDQAGRRRRAADAPDEGRARASPSRSTPRSREAGNGGRRGAAPVLKPADDKFIDKLLKEESARIEEEGRLVPTTRR